MEKIEVFHLGQQKEHTVRLDSGRKLMRECVMSHRLDSRTAILEYNRVEAEVEADTPGSVSHLSSIGLSKLGNILTKLLMKHSRMSSSSFTSAGSRAVTT